MRAYVDFSLSRLYAGLLPHRRLVAELEEIRDESFGKKTMFACFAELEHPATKLATYRNIMHWLYPGGYSSSAINLDVPPGGIESTAIGGAAGGHATNRDETLRRRLLALIERIDRGHFDGLGAKITTTFGCDRKSLSAKEK